MNNSLIEKNIVELLHLFCHNEPISANNIKDVGKQISARHSSFARTQVSEFELMRQLTVNHSHPQELVDRFEELKKIQGKNKDFDSIIYLLSRINADDKLKVYLNKNAQQLQRLGAEGTSSSSNLSNDEVAQLRTSILEATSKRSAELAFKSRLFDNTDENRLLPELSQWIRSRPLLTLNYVFNDYEPSVINSGLGALPLQEHAIIEDLLCCLGGIPGVFIVPMRRENVWTKMEFKIDESIDLSLKNLIKKVLPLCSDISTLNYFIEENSYFSAGQVKQALSAALRTIIKDYFFLVAQLDHQYRQGVLSLQKLWFFIQPTMRTMNILSSIVSTICKDHLIASEVLSLLHERTCSLTGDSKAQELTLYLTQAACQPYFENLEQWIYKGIISDPFHEVLNYLPGVLRRFWEKRYTICKKRIPVFLGKLEDMILHTGKYLNVIQQCNQNVKCPNAEEIVYTLDERQYVEKIEKSFTLASKKLLNLLLEEKDLIGRLKSVKHYFLLDQGDFIVQFMDIADEELRKNVDDVIPTRLESLLELSLRTSVTNVDPYKDDVKIYLFTEDLLSQISSIVSIQSSVIESDLIVPAECSLTGIESFSFDYKVKWPLSLILNQTALNKYQMLFRHLFHLKHVERVLGNVWLSNKVAKSYLLSASRLYFPAFDLRQRMLNFLQHLEYYMTFEVLEPQWHIFMNKLQSVSNVDDVLHCHEDFLNICLEDCMLTNTKLLQIVYKLMKLSTDFSKFILVSNKYSIDAEMSSMIDSTQCSNMESLELADGLDSNNALAGGSFEQTIKNFDTEFTKYLVILLSEILEIGRSKSNENLVNILIRLNFNEFYSDHLEKYRANLAEKTNNVNGNGKKKPPVPPKSPKIVKLKHGK